MIDAGSGVADGVRTKSRRYALGRTVAATGY